MRRHLPLSAFLALAAVLLLPLCVNAAGQPAVIVSGKSDLGYLVGIVVMAIIVIVAVCILTHQNTTRR